MVCSLMHMMDLNRFGITFCIQLNKDKIMKIEEALGLVEEIKNCSLPWDDAHWEALGIVINYVKNNLNKEDK